jgi:hypothetical protein
MSQAGASCLRGVVSMRKIIIFVALAGLLASACYPSPIQPGAAARPGVPVISSFYANPATITNGQSSNLVWNVAGATSVTISPSLGPVGPSGSLTITPGSSTTYLLTASGSTGSQTAGAVVTVNPAVTPPAIKSFKLTPAFINPGQTSSLVWNVQGAESVRIDPGIGTVPPSGNQVVSPPGTTTYILTATGPSGILTTTATLSVASYPTFTTGSSVYPPYPIYPYRLAANNLPVIVTFSVDPPVIAPGEAVVIRWDVVGAYSAYISPGPGQVPNSGAYVFTPYTSTYYTVTAINDVGSSTAAATVSVYPYVYYDYPAPNPIVSVPFPGLERNEWPSVEAPSAVSPPAAPSTTAPSGSEGGGSYAPYGGTTGRADSAVIPDITRSGAGGKKILPRIQYFTCNPAGCSIGGSAQLQWKVNGATSVNISPDIGEVPASGMVAISPSYTTVYTITASNSDGVVQHPQEVTVRRMIQPPGG